MLHIVTSPTRFAIASVVLAGALLATSVAGAAPIARPSSVKPAPAPCSSTRHVARASASAGVHHRRHTRTHHTEPNLREHKVTAASLPAPARPRTPRVPRSSHRAAAPVISHRTNGSPRTSGSAGLPMSAAGALSIAVLGTCVHQRTRDRLRSISEPLESRGPPRAGPIESSFRRWRGARESSGDASAPPPLLGSRTYRVNPSPDRLGQHPPLPVPGRPPLERPILARNVVSVRAFERSPILMYRGCMPHTERPVEGGDSVMSYPRTGGFK